MKYHQQKLVFNKVFNRRQFARLFLDPILMVLMLYFVALLHKGSLQPEYVVLSILTFTLSFPGFWNYQQRFFEDVKSTLTHWGTVIGILLLFGYTTEYLSMYSRDVLVTWFLVTPLALISVHFVVGGYLSSQYFLSKISKTAVIVGHNDLGMQLYRRVQANASHAIVIKGFFDDVGLDTVERVVPLIGKVYEVAQYVKQHAIDIIYIALPASLDSKVLPLLDYLKDTTASIYFVPDFFMTDLIQARIDDIDGMPVVALCETPFSGVNGFIKRLSDVALALFILMMIFPLMILIAIAVKLSSPGPVIFKQRRYGLDGKEIVVYKFRSMTVTEDGARVVQATVNDSRVTPIGRFLRKASLDELPQFINVLQGHMSIVGPRPHAVTHNETYRKLIKGYMVRHKVKPGITGWAQINGFRGETATVESMKQRIDYDLEYLKIWSLRLDIEIIVKTIGQVFKDSKAY
ncbi:MAG: undecaprenyl-phosphate glucose phosphotransferase [Methylophilus sp.]